MDPKLQRVASGSPHREMWSFQIGSPQVEAVTEAHKNVAIPIHDRKPTQRDVAISDRKSSCRGSHRSPQSEAHGSWIQREFTY